MLTQFTGVQATNKRLDYTTRDEAVKLAYGEFRLGKSHKYTMAHLSAVLREFETIVAKPDVDETYAEDLMNIVIDFYNNRWDSRLKESGQHLINLISAFKKEDWKKVAYHLSRVRKVVHVSANDSPYQKGEHISLIRTEHGWHNGDICGKVVGVHNRENGTHYYDVLVDNDCGYGAGCVLELSHTRDASRTGY